MLRPCQQHHQQQHGGGIPDEPDRVVDRNIIIPTVVIPEGTDNPNLNGVYLSTANNRSMKIPEPPDGTIDLKSASCMKVLHRAALYRLAAGRPNKSGESANQLSSSRLAAIVSTKSLAKRVRRRRRKNATESQSDAADNDVLTDPLDAIDLEDDSDLPVRRNGDEDEDIQLDPSESWSTSQKLYQNACKVLGVIPSAYFMRHLEEETISMRHSVLGPMGAKACAISLVENVTTRTVDFEDNNFGSDGARHMAQMLQENFSIVDLTISENNIGSQGLEVLVEVIKEQDSIRRLDISGNGFGERDARYIAELLQENRLLTDLRVSHNHFMEDGAIVIAKALALNSTLEEIDLSWNHIRKKGAVAICDSLKKNTSLRILNVAWNGFGIEGCKAMGRAMKVNKTLLELDMICNRIDLKCLTELLTGLKMNTGLTCLKLGDNPLSNEGAVTILRMLETYVGVKINDLDISGQCVDQEFMRVLAILRQNRLLKVQHGYVMTQEGGQSIEDQEFLNEDPMVVLMEFMRIQNFRLVDLFTSLDKDGSKSLTRQEFREGLLSVNIPMSPAALNKLIDKLDTDGDGEVDFKELLEGRKLHKVKMFKMKQKHKNVPFHETQIGRINTKIRALLALRFAASKEAKEDAAFERKNTLARSRILSKRPSVSLEYSLGGPVSIPQYGGISSRRPSISGSSRRPSISGPLLQSSMLGDTSSRRPSISGSSRRPSISGSSRRPSISGPLLQSSMLGDTSSRRPSISGSSRRPSISGLAPSTDESIRKHSMETPSRRSSKGTTPSRRVSVISNPSRRPSISGDSSNMANQDTLSPSYPPAIVVDPPSRRPSIVLDTPSHPLSIVIEPPSRRGSVSN